jgi:acyl carrier protein
MSVDLLRQAFTEALDLSSDTEVEHLEIGNHAQWDSVAHMALVAELEDRFDIEFETDDIVDMSSYAKSIEILRRYGVQV